MITKKKATKYLNQLASISVCAKAIEADKRNYASFLLPHLKDKSIFTAEVRHYAIKLRSLKQAYKMLQRGAAILNGSSISHNVLHGAMGAGDKILDVYTMMVAVENWRKNQAEKKQHK